MGLGLALTMSAMDLGVSDAAGFEEFVTFADVLLSRELLESRSRVSTVMPGS